MTYNDPNWSVFWACGANGGQSRPDANGLRTGKHVGGDTVLSRATEQIGYIVMESGMQASFGGITNEAGQGPVIVQGYVEGDYIYDFSAPFIQAPEVLIVSQTQMGGTGTCSLLDKRSLFHTFFNDQMGAGLFKHQIQAPYRSVLRSTKIKYLIGSGIIGTNQLIFLPFRTLEFSR